MAITVFAGLDCDDNNSAIHDSSYLLQGCRRGWLRRCGSDPRPPSALLTLPAGYADNSSGFDVDDTDPFYTNHLTQTCEVKIIPKILGGLIGDKERTRSLLVIGSRARSWWRPGDKWKYDAIDVVSTRVFFKRFMLMRVTLNGEPLEWEEYHILLATAKAISNGAGNRFRGSIIVKADCKSL